MRNDDSYDRTKAHYIKDKMPINFRSKQINRTNKPTLREQMLKEKMEKAAKDARIEKKLTKEGYYG